MNSSGHCISSNIDPEKRSYSFWKKKDIDNTNFSSPNISLSEFLEENDKKSNYIEFADVDLKKCPQKTSINL